MERELYFYLGRDNTHSYPAVQMRNMLILNHSTYGESLVNNIIIRTIMEHNPKDVRFDIFSPNNMENIVNTKLWRKAINGKRIIPQFRSITSYDLSDAGNMLSVMYDIEMDKSQKNIIIIDNAEEFFSALFAEEKAKFISLLDNAESNNTVFILACQDLDNYSEFLDSCDIRCCFVSKQFEKIQPGKLGISYPFERGTVIYTDENDDNISHKLFIPFFPNTWIEKFCRYYGVVTDKEL